MGQVTPVPKAIRVVRCVSAARVTHAKPVSFVRLPRLEVVACPDTFEPCALGGDSLLYELRWRELLVSELVVNHRSSRRVAPNGISRESTVRFGTSDFHLAAKSPVSA
jgi:hypothetical protein